MAWSFCSTTSRTLALAKQLSELAEFVLLALDPEMFAD